MVEGRTRVMNHQTATILAGLYTVNSANGQRFRAEDFLKAPGGPSSFSAGLRARREAQGSGKG